MLNKIMKNGKALYLAYDQGLEHGPSDFNDKNVDPNYILDIAEKGKLDGVILQKGIAKRYYKKRRVPLILKLNGKTNLVKGDPIARQLCSVDEAVKLGAKAVGVMFKVFENIQIEAHKKNLPVIAWIYPRGKSIKGKSKKELMAYASRTGLEIGADIIKIKYNGNVKDLKWAVKNAGKVKVVIAGGVKKDERVLLKQVREIMGSGCAGLAIGRNIWQNKKPLIITKKIKKIIWK